MDIQNLNSNFPGGHKQSINHYQYYLVGDIFASQHLNISMKIYKQVEEASIALGRFSALIEKIPNPTNYISAYAKKEATKSSQIEGTQTNIEDAFIEEKDISLERRDDWQELHCYIKALNLAVEQLDTLPLCNRLIKQTHRILLSQARGKHKKPGEFRTSQNWIGGSRPDNARFVPPAAEYIDSAMSNLEKFIQDKTIQMPALIKAALIHYQFETLHPFLDGNGRIGRMLISLFLLEQKILKHPILYISDFFESNRANYYDALDRARQDKDGVSHWVSFFIDGVYQTATKGIQSTQKILDLQAQISTQQIPTLGRQAKNAQRLLDVLFNQMIVNSNTITKALDISANSAQKLIASFVKLGILKEITGYKRNRVFIFNDYLKLLHD